MINTIENTFTAIGGQFISPPAVIIRKLQHIKAFVFDWDGVFNTGIKSSGRPNGFSETDSMGINLMRYDYYSRKGQLPHSAIITGQENPTALEFARRESFYSIYFNIKNKNEAFDHFCKTHNLLPENVAWFFDDILDLDIAKRCGVRFYLGGNYQPLTEKFIIENQMVDYITANKGGRHGLRECTELVMGLNGNFNKLVDNRLSFSDHYAEYFSARNGVQPVIFTKKETGIEEVTL